MLTTKILKFRRNKTSFILRAGYIPEVRQISPEVEIVRYLLFNGLAVYMTVAAHTAEELVNQREPLLWLTQWARCTLPRDGSNRAAKMPGQWMDSTHNWFDICDHDY